MKIQLTLNSFIQHKVISNYARESTGVLAFRHSQRCGVFEMSETFTARSGGFLGMTGRATRGALKRDLVGSK